MELELMRQKVGLSFQKSGIKMRQFAMPTVVLLVLAAPLRADDSAHLKKITTIEGITEYHLPNGFKVLLFPDPSKPTVTVNLTIFVGSRHEGYGEAGMAHLLEHMLFKGTPTHSNIPGALRSRGAQYNGTTWLDRTNYYETLPANDENLEFVIRLEADRMMNSYIKSKDLASEMTVVRSEFEQGENNSISVLRQRMMSVAFEWHNYGRATIGNRSDIERVPVESLRTFYKKHYQPDNAMLVVAGQFDPKNALGYVQKHFGAIPPPKRKLDTTYTEEPPQDGERTVTLRRVGDVSVVAVLYHIPSGSHPDYAGLDVLETIFTAPPAGRLYKALVESKKAARVYGFALALHDPGVFGLTAEITTGNEPQVVLGTLLDVVEQVAKKGVADEEVERAKHHLMKQVELAATDSRRTAIELSEWAAQGDWRLKFLYRDRLETVNANKVKDVAARYLRSTNRTAGVYLPIKKPQRVAIPSNPDLAKMIGNYQGRPDISTGEAFDISPANIDARTQRFSLPGGLKVAFLPKKTRGESVNLQLTMRYGNENNLKGLKTACEFLPLLMVRGTKNLTRQQIQDELDKTRTRLLSSHFNDSGQATFTLQTKRANLKSVLQLLRQILREPTLPGTELDILKQGRLTSLEKQLTDPQTLALRVLRRKFRPYANNDPRYEPTIQEEIKRVRSVTSSTVQKLYEEYFAANSGELAVVGDFDIAETRDLLTTMFSDWKALKHYAHIPHYGNFKVKGGTTQILTPDKANANYFSGQVFPMKDSHPDYAVLLLGNYILGGSSHASRLGNRVRQQDGLSYTIRSHLFAMPLDERTSLTIFAICNPVNVDKVEKAIREEVETLLKKGVTHEELDAAKRGFLQGQKVGRTDDSNLTRILAKNMFANRTMAYQAELEKVIQAVTSKQVMTVLRKYIDPKQFVVVIAGDFKKNATSDKNAVGNDKSTSVRRTK